MSSTSMGAQSIDSSSPRGRSPSNSRRSRGNTFRGRFSSFRFGNRKSEGTIRSETVPKMPSVSTSGQSNNSNQVRFRQSQTQQTRSCQPSPPPPPPPPLDERGRVPSATTIIANLGLRDNVSSLGTGAMNNGPRSSSIMPEPAVPNFSPMSSIKGVADLSLKGVDIVFGDAPSNGTNGQESNSMGLELPTINEQRENSSNNEPVPSMKQQNHSLSLKARLSGKLSNSLKKRISGRASPSMKALHVRDVSNSMDDVEALEFANMPSMDDPKVIVIAISGATRSGKGILVDRLFMALGGGECCKRICQDTCLKGIRQDPGAMNHDLFLESVNQLIAESRMDLMESGFGSGPTVKYVILEGFLSFYDERILQLSDYKIWLEIPRDVCYQRRMRTKPVPEEYFRSKLWPGYQAYRQRVFGNERLRRELIVIDGTWKMQIILERVLREIRVEYVTEDKKEDNVGPQVVHPFFKRDSDGFFVCCQQGVLVDFSIPRREP